MGAYKQMRADEVIKNAEFELSELYKKLDETALFNQDKVLKAFQKFKVAQRHFAGTTGYGYDDIGRDTLCNVYADIFKSEKALVSPNIVSGTHALTIMLFGILRPNDNLLAISGQPYDTLNDVLIGDDVGSLKDFGVNFDKIDLLTDTDDTPKFDLDKIKDYITTKGAKAVFIQRSRGYNWRQALSCAKISLVCKMIKQVSPKTVILVDNCYGEFVEKTEPIEIGADVIAGSLIKNAGGGFAPTGGYIAGYEKYITQISYRLTASSIGNEVGSYSYGYLPFYQGLFMAPTTTKNALKCSVLFAKCFSLLGFSTMPKSNHIPYDIVTSINFDKEEQLIAFCRSIQYASPIDSNLTLEPWDMPGYQNQVIMAAGTFIQGASIELSADSPIKAPYIAYLQGALTYEHAIISAKFALESIIGK
ncbi:MAG: methionine gamma-lyase family protein [Clostridia bacterium]|nr:methionine gamma-lyase family protein [Clostridia bacterium]